MRQPGMLVLLSAQGEAWSAASATVLRAGHLPLDAAPVEAALRQDGPASAAARRLAGQCDAGVLRGAPALSALFRRLRRPVYADAALLPRAAPVPPPASGLPLGLETALRSLDR